MALETKLNLRLPADLRARIETIAAAEGRSLGDVVRRILEAYLKEHGDDV